MRDLTTWNKVKPGDIISFRYKTEILSGLKGEELIIDKGSTEVMDGSYVKIKN